MTPLATLVKDLKRAGRIVTDEQRKASAREKLSLAVMTLKSRGLIVVETPKTVAAAEILVPAEPILVAQPKADPAKLEADRLACSEITGSLLQRQGGEPLKPWHKEFMQRVVRFLRYRLREMGKYKPNPRPAIHHSWKTPRPEQSLRHELILARQRHLVPGVKVQHAPTARCFYGPRRLTVSPRLPWNERVGVVLDNSQEAIKVQWLDTGEIAYWNAWFLELWKQ